MLPNILISAMVLLASIFSSYSYVGALEHKQQELEVGALSVLSVPQGGTGNASFPSGDCLKGNGTGPLTSGSCGTGGGSVGATSTLTASSPLSLSGAVAVFASAPRTLTIDTSGAWSGNAGTATALAANGSNCSAGSFPLGVNASGAVENCTDAWTEAENTAAAYTPQARTLTATYPVTGGGDLTANRAFALAFGTTTSNTWAGTQTFTNQITASISGNAGTATALAANGSNCSAGNYPLGIDASGNVENCTAAGAGGSSFPFSADTNFGQVVYSTSTPTLWFKNGFFASSTSRLYYASTTAISATTLFGALVGNASTATALAANGTNASAGNAILGVDAFGNAEGAFDVWTEAENTAAAYIASVTANSPLSGAGTSASHLTIADAVANGSTKGAASFTAADFNDTSGNISIDYTNGQAAASGVKGFLTAADWATFNGKVASTRALTIAGTASQINSSAGTQDLSSDRTWTLSLPSHVTFPGNFQVTNSTTTNATTTSLYIKGLAVAAGALLAVDQNGQVIATSTPAGGGYSPVGSVCQFPYFSASNTLTATSTPCLSANGNLGIGSTTPWAKFSVVASTTGNAPLFAIASSTAGNSSYPLFQVDQWGHFISSGPPPTVDCSGGIVTGNDHEGYVLCNGGAVTGITLTFAHSYPVGTTVICFGESAQGTNATIRQDIAEASVSSVVLRASTGIASWYYRCGAVK